MSDKNRLENLFDVIKLPFISSISQGILSVELLKLFITYSELGAHFQWCRRWFFKQLSNAITHRNSAKQNLPNVHELMNEKLNESHKFQTVLMRSVYIHDWQAGKCTGANILLFSGWIQRYCVYEASIWCHQNTCLCGKIRFCSIFCYLAALYLTDAQLTQLEFP